MKQEQILDKQDEYESDPEYVVLYKNISKQLQENIDCINEIIREIRYFYEYVLLFHCFHFLTFLLFHSLLMSLQINLFHTLLSYFLLI